MEFSLNKNFVIRKNTIQLKKRSSMSIILIFSDNANGFFLDFKYFGNVTGASTAKNRWAISQMRVNQGKLQRFESRQSQEVFSSVYAEERSVEFTDKVASVEVKGKVFIEIDTKKFICSQFRISMQVVNALKRGNKVGVVFVWFIFIEDYIDWRIDFFAFWMKNYKLGFAGVDCHFVCTKPNSDFVYFDINVVNQGWEVMVGSSSKCVISEHRCKEVSSSVKIINVDEKENRSQYAALEY